MASAASRRAQNELTREQINAYLLRKLPASLDLLVVLLVVCPGLNGCARLDHVSDGLPVLPVLLQPYQEIRVFLVRPAALSHGRALVLRD